MHIAKVKKAVVLATLTTFRIHDTNHETAPLYADNFENVNEHQLMRLLAALSVQAGWYDYYNNYITQAKKMGVN